MYIVNIIKKNYDKADYSSLVGINPCIPLVFKEEEEAESYLKNKGFEKPDERFKFRYKLWTKGDDIAYIFYGLEIEKGSLPDPIVIPGASWSEGHCE